MRAIDEKYSFWLAGFYDDFNGARVIPDDSNTIGTAYNSINGHHGNPINGTASLNPRFTYAWVERGDATGGRFNNTIVVAASSGGKQYLHNTAISDWLTYDENRDNSDKWEGRAQLQYPDSITNANRQKYDGGTGILGNAYLGTDTADGYIWLCNGYDTSGKYWIPTGDNDSTFGRDAIKPFSVISGGNIGSDCGTATTSKAASSPQFIQKTNLISVLMGEKFDDTISSWPYADVILYPLKSPAGKPFLHIEQFRDMNADNAYKPALIYDGSLNSIGSQDTLTMRMNMQAYQALVGGATWSMKIGAGFGTEVPTSAGYTGTPAIEFEMDISGNITGGTTSAPFGGVKLFDYWDDNTETTYTDTQMWMDIDFVIDYDAPPNGVFKVFIDGTQVPSVGHPGYPMPGGTTTATFSGFQISTRQGTISAPGSSTYWTGLFSLDRVGMVRYLTNDLEDNYVNYPVESLTWNRGVNAPSSATISIGDDSNSIGSQIVDLVQSSSFSNWSLMFFRDNIDRPLWRGTVTGMSNTQSAKDGKNDISISATDHTTLLDHEIPNWEVGQGGDADSTDTISFMRNDAQSKLDTYYFGVERLQASNATLGYSYSADDSKYIPHTDSRMNKNSAHPIQVYNNENKGGPNSVEDDWGQQPFGPAFYDASLGYVVMHDIDNRIVTGGITTIKLNDDNLIAAGDYTLTSNTVTYGNDTTLNTVGFPAGSPASINPTDPITWVSPSFGTWTPGDATDNGDIVYTENSPYFTTQTMPSVASGGFVPYVYHVSAEFPDPNNGNVNSRQIRINCPAAVGATPTQGELLSIDNLTTSPLYINELHGIHTVRASSAGSFMILVNIPYPAGLTWFPSNIVFGDGTGTYSPANPTTIKVDDVTQFPGGGGTCTTDGETFDYTGTDERKKTLTGCNNFSGPITTNKEIVYNQQLTTIVATGDWTTKISRGDYITLNQGTPITYEGIYRVQQDPVFAAGNTTFKITLDVNTDTFLSGSYQTTYGQPQGNWNPDYRSIHGRWIRDLPQSKWFQYMFGRIEKDHAGEASLVADIAANATTMTVDSPSIIAGIEQGNYAFEIIDADGSIDAGVLESYSGGSIIPSGGFSFTKLVPTNTPPYFLEYKNEIRYNNRPLVLLITDTTTRAAIGAGSTVSIYDSELEVVIYDEAKQSWEEVVSLNGEYELAKYTGAPPDAGGIESYVLLDSNGRHVKIGQKAITTKIADLGTISYATGNITVTLPSTNLLSRGHSAGATIKLRNIGDDYKHIWVLWADMRNNGSADADGGTRKKKFGLLYPTNSNYSVTLQWADQDINAYEGRNAWVDLKMGDDIDIWEIDAEVEPVSGGTWAALGSDSEADSQYHNWEDKAGSFLIIDTSKFFNLNTQSNDGKTGQYTGGSKELGDFLIETEGFPVLIDNYWVEAAATERNADGDFITPNASWTNFISDASPVSRSIEVGHKWVQIDDATNWPSSGQGKMFSDKKDTIWFYSWSSKGMSFGINAYSQTDDTLTFTTTTNPHTLHEGMRVTISTNGLTPDVDGEFIISDIPAVNQFSIFYTSTVTGTLTGTNTVSDDNSLYVHDRLVCSPPQRGSSEGEWNGLSYINDDTITVAGWTAERFLYEPVGGVLNASAGTSATTAYLDSTLGFSSSGRAMFLNNMEREEINFSNKDDATATLTISNPAKKRVNGELVYQMKRNGVEANILTVGEGDSIVGDLVAYNTLSNVFPMRMLMQMDGFVKSGNCGTFFEHDKMRLVWNDVLTNKWFNQSVLSGMYDINNAPLGNNMTTSQKSITTAGKGGYVTSYTAANPSVITSVGHGLTSGDVITIAGTADVDGVGLVVTALTADTYSAVVDSSNAESSVGAAWWITNEFDDYGSVNDARSQTVLGAITSSREGSGTGDTNGQVSTYAWLMGRDGRMEYRPSYTSGFAFNRNNLVISNMDGQTTNQITNVRVLYSGGSAFVDYPAPALNTRSRWKLLQHPNISSQEEATAVAKLEYNKEKESPLSISASIQRLDDYETFNHSKDLLFDGGVYGYIADPKRLSFGAGDDKAYWCNQRGGSLFPGLTNALDGRAGGANASGTSLLKTYDEWYYWYGANSVSHAVQIVSMPRKMPKSSETAASSGYITDQLRIAISIDHNMSPTTSVDNARFKIILMDCEFKTDDATASHTPSFKGLVKSNASIIVQGNGFYEIGIPSTYGATSLGGDEKIVISVNYDYLQALLRNRCGSTSADYFFRNGHAVPSSFGVDSPSTTDYNWDSIFPLGIREYGEAGPIAGSMANSDVVSYSGGGPTLTLTDTSDFGPKGTAMVHDSGSSEVIEWTANVANVLTLTAAMTNAPGGGEEVTSLGGDSDASIKTNRSLWYAPRIHVVDDVNFVPATTVEYTDSYLGLSAEPMVIKSVNYTVNNTSAEKLSFEMERDMSRAATGFTEWFRPISKGRMAAGVNTPAGGLPNSFTGAGGAWNPNYGTVVKEGGGNMLGNGNAQGGIFSGIGQDIASGTNMSQQFSPLQHPSPAGADTPSPTSNQSGAIGVGSLTKGFAGKIKGAMDLTADGVLGGDFSILGQNKAGSPPSGNSAVVSQSPKVSVSSGNAFVGDEKIVFPGTIGEATDYPYHEVIFTAYMPEGVKSNLVSITASVSMTTLSQSAVLTTNVTTGAFDSDNEQTSTISGDPTKQRITLYSGVVGGADVAGGEVSVTIARSPDNGSDDAKYSAVILDNVQVTVKQNSVTGTTSANQMTYSL